MSKPKFTPVKERPPSAPHSWELGTWPSEVWPHDPKRAQWIARAYRKELVAAGAISRVGKVIVFSGAKYSRWLESRAHHVVEFASNNPEIGARKLKRQCAQTDATPA
jgi:hypothetical protein